MLFDDLSMRMQILLGLFVPPLLTVICWFGARRFLRARPDPTLPRGKSGFWALLISAYLLYALAMYSSRFFAGTDRADPTTQLLQ
jgi:hypothetical protein